MVFSTFRNNPKDFRDGSEFIDRFGRTVTIEDSIRYPFIVKVDGSPILATRCVLTVCQRLNQLECERA